MEEKEYFHMYEQEQSHWWYAGMRAIVLSLLPPDDLPANALVLDAGCGTGYNLGWFRKHYGARVVGVDFSRLGLAFCRRRGEQAVVCADAATLPFASGAFDLVVSLDVLGHLKTETARARALREFGRVLRPGGRLLLRVAAHEWLRSSHDEAIRTYHRYERMELRSAVLNAGFRLLRMTGANSLLFPAAVLWRILKKAGWVSHGSDVRASTRGGERLNQTLTAILKAEAAILRRTKLNIPWGLSILLLAAKP